MAEQKNKKRINPSVGFYSEPGFVSLTSSLRKISGDDTIPTDKYVDIYKDLYDLITPDEVTTLGGVVDVLLAKDKKTLLIQYANESQKTLTLEDNALFQVYYDNSNKLIYFVLNNGSKVTLDLNFLEEQFATKVEVNEIKNEIKELTTNVNNIEVQVTKNKNDIKELTTNTNNITIQVTENKNDITEIENDIVNIENKIIEIENIIEEGTNVMWKEL